jgi:Phosphodiester glycosidase
MNLQTTPKNLAAPLAALLLGLLTGCAGPMLAAPNAGAASTASAASAASAAGAEPVWRTLNPGLRYAVINPWPSSRVHVLQLDLREPSLRLQVSPPAARGLTMDQLAGDPAVLASVNASFFGRGHVPRGWAVSDGVVWPGVFLPAQSPALVCDRAQRCVVDFAPQGAAPQRAFNVVAGTPWLVRDGQARSAADDATCAALCAQLHPRTVAGLDARGHTLTLVLAEGRRGAVGGAVGVALAPLAVLLQGLGVHQAINLDGGGSSTLWLQGRAVMGRPANEPNERALSTALQIVRVGVGEAHAPGATP